MFPSIPLDSDDEMHPIPFDFDEETQQESQTIYSLQLKSYKLHSINSTIVIRQLPSQGLSFQLWPAADTLVTLLDIHRNSTPLSSFSSLPQRIRILELGSGTGVVGIASAALLGADVTVTDLPHVLSNMMHNVEANAEILKLRGGSVSVVPLSWGKTQDMETVGPEFDMIVASDVVYHDHLYEPLLQTLQFFLLGGGRETIFLMSHLKRWKKESAFFRKATKYFDVKVIHTDTPCNGSRVGVKVYHFGRKGGLVMNG